MSTKKTQLDLLTTALEGGSNYWYFLPDLSMIPAENYTPTAPEIEEGFEDCTVNRIWEAVQNGVEVPVFDAENEDDQLGVISLKNIEEAEELMKENGYDDELTGEEDAEVADVWFQLVVMKEIVFG